MKHDVVKRHSGNPILTKAEVPYPVETVHNAGVVKHGNEYIMLFRSHLRTGRSIIGLARSTDGFRFIADPEPFLTPEPHGSFAAYEEYGVEDPRVTSVCDTADRLFEGRRGRRQSHIGSKGENLCASI